MPGAGRRTRAADEELIRTHSDAGDNSGGEQEKLMAFCLAGALSFNLASPKVRTTHRFSRN